LFHSDISICAYNVPWLNSSPPSSPILPTSLLSLGWQAHNSTPSFFLLRWGAHKLFLPRLSRNCNFPSLSLLPDWDDRYMPPHPAIGWDAVWKPFCPDWPRTVILLVSASQVARIISVRSRCPALLGVLETKERTWLDCKRKHENYDTATIDIYKSQL
jgi:hypothetical protein